MKDFSFEHVKHLIGVDIMSDPYETNRYLDAQDTLDNRDERLRKLYPLDEILDKKLCTYFEYIVDEYADQIPQSCLITFIQCLLDDRKKLIEVIVAGSIKEEISHFLSDEIMHYVYREQDRLVNDHED